MLMFWAPSEDGARSELGHEIGRESGADRIWSFLVSVTVEIQQGLCVD